MGCAVPGAKATREKLIARAIDFEAPITITVAGRTAAVIRFAAHLNGCTPEEELNACIAGRAACDLENGFGHTPQSVKEWLGAERPE